MTTYTQTNIDNFVEEVIAKIKEIETAFDAKVAQLTAKVTLAETERDDARREKTTAETERDDAKKNALTDMSAFVTSATAASTKLKALLDKINAVSGGFAMTIGGARRKGRRKNKAKRSRRSQRKTKGKAKRRSRKHKPKAQSRRGSRRRKRSLSPKKRRTGLTYSMSD